MKYLRNLPQPTYLGGFTTQAEVVLEVERGEERASAPFTHRRIGTHYAYVHQCGLSLIISHARERGGVMIHETEVAVDALVDSVLEDLGTLLDFLELCGEDAVIREVSHDESVRHRFEVAQLFQPLHTIAAFVASWRICAMIEGWPERCVALNEVADPEVFYTLSGFARLVEQPDFIAAASFFLDRVTNPISREELTEAQTTAYAPFIGNWQARPLCCGSPLPPRPSPWTGRCAESVSRTSRRGLARCGNWSPRQRSTPNWPSVVTRLPSRSRPPGPKACSPHLCRTWRSHGKREPTSLQTTTSRVFLIGCCRRMLRPLHSHRGRYEGSDPAL